MAIIFYKCNMFEVQATRALVMKPFFINAASTEKPREFETDNSFQDNVKFPSVLHHS